MMKTNRVPYYDESTDSKIIICSLIVEIANCDICMSYVTITNHPFPYIACMKKKNKFNFKAKVAIFILELLVFS